MIFYIVNLIIVPVCFVVYFAFRAGVDDYLKYKTGKTFKKPKKGFINFWTYRKLHKEVGLGIAYPLNLVLLFTFLLYAIITVGFGWLETMQLPIIISLALFSLVAVPASLFSWFCKNRVEFGEAIVLFKYYRRDGNRSLALGGLLAAFLPLICLIVNLMLYARR